MRILMVSDVYFPRVNGVSTSIETFRACLAAQGIEVRLVVPAYRGEAGEPGIVRVPVQPVEVLVAASIAVGAWHAWRPLRFGSEVGMAAGFGLVHGLAFSASLDGAGLTAWQHAQALMAFNLGIEAVQVLLALLVMPGLLWLAHHRPEGYAGLRRITAGAAAALALFWSLQRVGLF